MAITVRNREELQRLALAKGASVTYADGRKFNTSKTVSSAAPVSQVAEVKAPEVAEDKTGQLVEAVMEQNAMLAAEQSRISAMVTQALALASQPDQAPREWVFIVERDKKDRLTRVIARPGV